jgi:hypothetical protein
MKKVLSKEDIKCCRFKLLQLLFLVLPVHGKALQLKKILTKNVYFIMYHSPLPAHLHIITIDGGYWTGRATNL